MDSDRRSQTTKARPGTRRAGLLLHPTSLPGPSGIGALGPDADRLIEWAASAGLTVWQFLPLTPAGAGHSPYSGPSAFAGNPWLISLRRLVEDGLLPEDAVVNAPRGASDRVDFARVLPWKRELLRRSFVTFRRRESAIVRRDYESFLESPSHTAWLPDWALFAALKEHRRGLPWYEWDPELRRRDPGALRAAAEELAGPIDYQRYLQFVLHRQWRRIRETASRHGVELLGDLPFYVAHDSADVWSRPELFRLDSDARPTHVAGVPPDYFSETGQLWGNPVYDWGELSESGYDWWVSRVRTQLEWTDRIRLDHFRAFESYWEVDAGESSAVNGRWAPGPGRALFDALERELGRLPFVAEDLGSITEEVRALRRELRVPGMRVLQFGFGGDENEHLPAGFPRDCVAYTGTHDNDTTRGWFRGLDRAMQRHVCEVLDASPRDVPWRLIEAAYGSPADLTVVPVQDFLGLGSAARMNRPAIPEGNWGYRVTSEQLTPSLASRLRELAIETNRTAGPTAEPG